ncbi:hypothetical protein [Thalassoroseus pseudoceratinae]|uniref:hypothetical protein n=1 Tax=Thalassoroseus pseudoceratinae TaxID=2713176 RepID=UPI00141E82AB|nr:hypothetical protein [Thalassoroseus pseudoceratinae]
MRIVFFFAAVALIGTGIAFRSIAAEESAKTELSEGHTVIRASAGVSEIVITTTSRLAGAIHSLTWNGQEFIDSFDHGRQLQSAANFDCGTKFTGETFNPTEAGSRQDGKGETSTSRLLHIVTTKDALQTTSQMAFWLTPGQKSAGHPAKNTEVLSNHLLIKRVQIGYDGLPNVIQYDVTFSMPIGEKHTYAQFEAVTGYMPAKFKKFWSFSPKTRELDPLSDGPGEQSRPVVFSTESGSHAMGVFSPDQPSPGYERAGYGRFRFPHAKVVKWNCVFRVRDANGVKPSEYSFRSFVVVGDLKMVITSLRTLHEKFASKTQAGSR